MAFDITKVSGLALKDSYELQLKNPVSDELLFDEDGKPVTITLYGKSSKPYRNAVTAMQNRELRRMHKKDVRTAEQTLEESTSLLVACSATSTLEINGVAVNDKDTFKQLYNDPRFSWIRDQVDEAIGDQANFLAV